MIDPRLLRDDPDLIRAAQAKRGLSGSVVDAALEADAARRTAIADFEQLRAEQKQLGKLIAKAQGDERADLLARTKTLAADVKGAELAQTEAEQDWRDAIYAIPNPAAEESPAGGEDDYVVLSEHGTPRDFEAEGFEPARPRRARPDPRRHRRRARRQGLRLALLLPDRGRAPTSSWPWSTWRWTRPARPGSPR